MGAGQYEIGNDPEEKENLIDSHPGKLVELLELLEPWVVQHGRPGVQAHKDAESEMDADTVRQLRSLGYVDRGTCGPSQFILDRKRAEQLAGSGVMVDRAKVAHQPKCSVGLVPYFSTNTMTSNDFGQSSRSPASRR